ncbi:MAG: hypothetical protein GX288_11045 [Clostridiales bacterium]|nr:hypothetical protein [Clostridiales bacterium]
MKRQLQGIAIILCSILLTLAYGGNAVGDLNLSWNSVFVLLGIVGIVFTFWPNKPNDKY